jgi:hypothetical protein
MKRSLAAVLAFSLVLLTGCGDKEVSATADNLPTVTTNMGEAPTIGAPSGNPPTTLVTKDIIVGTGTEAIPTSTMTVHYTLMTWSNGALIESSWNGGSPATFPLANVIVDVAATSAPVPTIISFDSRVVGGVPLGAPIVGASPILAVTVGKLSAVALTSVSPHPVSSTSEKAKIPARLRFIISFLLHRFHGLI